MTTCTGWLFLSECSTSLLWQSIVVFGTKLHATSPTTVRQFSKFLVASICDLPDVINCQFREFAAELWDPCIFCRWTDSVEFTTPNRSGGTWRRICSPDIRSVGALEMLRNRAIQIEIYLLHLYASVTWDITVHYSRITNQNGSRWWLKAGGCRWRQQPSIGGYSSLQNERSLLDLIYSRTASVANDEGRVEN